VKKEKPSRSFREAPFATGPKQTPVCSLARTFAHALTVIRLPHGLPGLQEIHPWSMRVTASPGVPGRRGSPIPPPKSSEKGTQGLVGLLPLPKPVVRARNVKDFIAHCPGRHHWLPWPT
jgi:hypothetical protein